MPAAGPAVSRRTLLITAATGAVLAACGGRRTAATSPDPDLTALLQAVSDERALLAGYDGLLGAAGTDPALERTRADHAQHLDALLGQLPASPAPTGTPSAAPVPAGRAGVRAAEAASVASLRAAAIDVRDGATAAVLASVAASHAALADTARAGSHRRHR